MLEQIIILTGWLFWIVVTALILMWLPLVPAFAIGWTCYKLDINPWIRGKSLSFAQWYAENVLKEVFTT